MEMNGFSSVAGGYEKEVSENARVFIPAACVKSFDDASGTVERYKPDYKPKRPARAAQIGVNYYRYENEEAPAGCDFEMMIGHYGGKFLKPLKPGLTIQGRGIKFDGKFYKVTDAAFEKLEKSYRILCELSFD